MGWMSHIQGVFQIQVLVLGAHFNILVTVIYRTPPKEAILLKSKYQWLLFLSLSISHAASSPSAEIPQAVIGIVHNKHEVLGCFMV